MEIHIFKLIESVKVAVSWVPNLAPKITSYDSPCCRFLFVAWTEVIDNMHISTFYPLYSVHKNVTHHCLSVCTMVSPQKNKTITLQFNIFYNLILWSNIARGVCRGLPCYAASPEKLFSFFEKSQPFHLLNLHLLNTIYYFYEQCSYL